MLILVVDKNKEKNTSVEIAMQQAVETRSQKKSQFCPLAEREEGASLSSTASNAMHALACVCTLAYAAGTLPRVRRCAAIGDVAAIRADTPCRMQPDEQLRTLSAAVSAG